MSLLSLPHLHLAIQWPRFRPHLSIWSNLISYDVDRHPLYKLSSTGIMWTCGTEFLEGGKDQNHILLQQEILLAANRKLALGGNQLFNLLQLWNG